MPNGQGVARTPAAAIEVTAVGESRVPAMFGQDFSKISARFQQPEREREREWGRGGYHGVGGGDAAFGEEAEICREDLEAWV